MKSKLISLDSPCRAGPAERRTMWQALSHWNSLRHDSGPPLIHGLDPGEDPELSPHLFVLTLHHRLGESRFTYCGAQLAHLIKGDPTGQSLNGSLPGRMAQQMVEFLKGAVQYRQPIADAGSLLNGDGTEMLYRNVLMPMIGDSGLVEHVFGCFSYCIVG